MNQIIYSKTTRNKIMLINNGYIYHFYNKNDAITRFRCADRKCKGAIFVKDDEIIEYVDHNHEKDQIKCDKIIVKNKLKTLANENITKNSEIISEVLISCNNELMITCQN